MPRYSLYALLVGVVCILIGAAGSIRVRIQAESRNQAVSLAMEWQVIRDMSAQIGADPADVLRRLDEAGLGTLVVNEDVAGDFFGRDIQRQLGARPNEYRIDPTLAKRIQEAWPGNLTPSPSEDGTAFLARSEIPRLLPLGIDPAAAELAKSRAMFLIARHINPVGSTEESIRRTLTTSQALRVDAYLPLGEQALGQRDLLRQTAELLPSLGLLYITPEFSKISGDARMASLLPEHLIRLHAAQQAEIDKLTPQDYVERYVRAGRERNIRILLLRPLTSAAENPVDALLNSVRLVRKGLEREGVPLGQPKPYERREIPSWTRLMLMVGIGAAGFAAALGIGRRGLAATLLQGIALPLPFLLHTLNPSLLALYAAILLPLVGVWVWTTRTDWAPWLSLVILVAGGMLGAMSVAGILNGLEYWVKVDEFSGVKAAHFLPILVTGAWLIGREIPWRAVMNQAITYGAVFLGLVILVLLMLMLIRTGNDNPGAVSGLELKMRNLLDSVLYVRPRTKEFAFGHPLLCIGCLAWATAIRTESRRLRILAAGLISIGMIGVTSIVNTFCHLHIPFSLSVARAVIGLGIGISVGMILWALIQRPLTKLVEVKP